MPTSTTTTTTTTTVYFTSLPKNLLLVFDFISLTATPAFHGIKNVPPGPHCVFTAADAGLAIRHGIWFVVSEDDPERSLLFRWCAEEERLIQVFEGQGGGVALVPSGTARGLRDQLGGGLVDYRIQQSGDGGGVNDDGDGDDDEEEEGGTGFDHDTSTTMWQSLTSYIDAEQLSQMLHPGPESTPDGEISTDGQPRWTITSSSATPQDAESENIPGIDPLAFTSSSPPTSRHQTRQSTSQPTSPPPPPESETLHLLPIDLVQTWPPGAIGRERTEAAQDRSWALNNLLLVASQLTTKIPSPTTTLPLGSTYLLATLQLTLLSTLLLSNPSTHSHWTRLTTLILTCRKAIPQIPLFFIAFLDVLAVQVRCLGDSTGGVFEAGGIVEEIREEFAVGGGGGAQGGGGGGLGGRTGRMRKLLEGFREGVEELLADADVDVEMATTNDHHHAQRKNESEIETDERAKVAALNSVKRALLHLYRVLDEGGFGGWEEGTTVLKRGLVTLEDGEQVELSVEGADEEEERGEWAPVVVEL